MFPQLKKIISKFVKNEEGTISKGSIIRLGLITGLISTALVNNIYATNLHNNVTFYCINVMGIWDHYYDYPVAAPTCTSGEVTTLTTAHGQGLMSDHVNACDNHLSGYAHQNVGGGSKHCNGLTITNTQTTATAYHIHNATDYGTHNNGGPGTHANNHYNGGGSDHVNSHHNQ